MSARKGFSREIIGLASAFFALVLGMWFYGLAGSFLIPYVSSPRMANLLGFLLVVLAVLLCGGILGWIVSRFLRTIGLSFLDRSAGRRFWPGARSADRHLPAYGILGIRAEVSEDGIFRWYTRGFAPYVSAASHTFVAIAPMELKSSFRKQYAQVKSALESGRNE